MCDTGGLQGLEATEKAMRAFCGSLDPASVPLTQAPDTWARLGAIARLALGAQCRMGTRVEESYTWKRDGERSAAHWMARHSGSSVQTAKDQLHTSAKVASLSAADEALASGELSVERVAAVADAAAVDPSAEERLLAKAHVAGMRELREACASAKAAALPDHEARYRKVHDERYYKVFNDVEGGRNLHVRNTPDVMAEIEAALSPFIEARFAAGRASGHHEGRPAYGADALLDMARAASGRGNGVRNGSKRPESKVIASVDHAALVRGHTEAGERCEIAGVGPVPVSTVRAMLGDAFLAAVVTDGVDVHTVAHLGRQVTSHQRTALEARGYRCECPDCDVASALEIDHVTGWTITHRTKLDDLVWLCRHHHFQKTHAGYRLTGPYGDRRWEGPEGPDPPSGTGPPQRSSAGSPHDASSTLAV